MFNAYPYQQASHEHYVDPHKIKPGTTCSIPPWGSKENPSHLTPKCYWITGPKGRVKLSHEAPYCSSSSEEEEIKPMPNLIRLLPCCFRVHCSCHFTCCIWSAALTQSRNAGQGLPWGRARVSGHNANILIFITLVQAKKSRSVH